MPSRGMKDTALQLDKRKQASKKVKIQFIEDTFVQFNVLDEYDELKYTGKIDIEKSIDETCACDSFLYGMKFYKVSEDSEKRESAYVNENGTVFQCKHIIRAKSMRKLGMSEVEF